MTYETAAAFRTALEARLAARARDAGTDLNRLRRRVVFERVLIRLEAREPGRWVLKGGMALEVRWPGRARATRDLDLAVRDAIEGEEEVRLALAVPLGTDADGDRFRFAVGLGRPLRTDEAGRPGWRLPVDAGLAGRHFERISVDVVVRPYELTPTERLPLSGLLDFAGITTRDIEVVARTQHFAEKLHALTRRYGDRHSTRVKDLADLVLLIDDGLQPSPELLDVVRRVFAGRATHELPFELADPPSDWADRYAELAADLDISATTVGQAMQVLRAFLRAVRSQEE